MDALRNIRYYYSHVVNGVSAINIIIAIIIIVVLYYTARNNHDGLGAKATSVAYSSYKIVLTAVLLW